MAYIGRTPQVGNYFTLDAITTSATATFNLLKGGVAYVPESAYHIFVSLNGVIQAPITAYTVSGSTIIFDSALASTDVINFITVLGDTLAIGTPSDATVTNAKIVDMAATKLTGSIADARVPASAVTQHVTGYDDNKIQSNIALLGFKTAVNGSLAKYNLKDQIIDEFTDATGVDASASTNEHLSAGVYQGKIDGTPTNNADNTSTDGSDTVLKWTGVTSSGNLQFGSTTSVEYLIVGGGGSGGVSNAGGGGAGGYLANGSAALSLTGGNAYTVTVGAGGASVTGSSNGLVGGASIMSGTGITTLTADGGGYGGVGANAGGTGGSGGGGGYNNAAGGAASGNGTGSAGGSGTSSAPAYGAGGGGGAGAVGQGGSGSYAGNGGIGIQNDITGTNTWYAGGGGGAADNNTAACGNQGSNNGRDKGGGGKGSAADTGTSSTYNDATANTGGGGGASFGSGTGASGDGGSGIVVVRFPTVLTINDLTLQSTDTTASTQASNADMVMLMENGSGTATLNTDIKGYISRDSGTTFTQGTLVDEGTWGTNKKILAFHDLDISGQPSGTDMCYKITTHNQSAGSKETKIHATSIGWR